MDSIPNQHGVIIDCLRLHFVELLSVRSTEEVDLVLILKDENHPTTGIEVISNPELLRPAQAMLIIAEWVVTIRELIALKLHPGNSAPEGNVYVRKPGAGIR